MSGAAGADAPVLVVGDVHGCSEELDQLIAMAGPCTVVLVGDLFSKGPDPVGVWMRIEATGAVAVRGNHDQWMLDHPDEAVARGLPPSAMAYMASLPLFLDIGGLCVVHAGVHPSLRAAATTARMAMTLRRWPDDRDRATPFWWEQLGPGPLVVYGHDAARGLQDHRPRSLGLDTGCVYGGLLTGYLFRPGAPLSGRLLQVPALRAYRPVEPGQPALGWRG